MTKLTTASVRMAIAFGLLITLTGSDMRAQTAPTLAVAVNVLQVSISWTSVTGALAYRLDAGSTTGAADIASLTFPANFALPLVATAPGGTYFLRVYAITPAGIGPASNEVSVTLPGGCSTLAAPTLTQSVLNQDATFTWNSITGAAFYVLQLGLAPGRTDFARQIDAPATSVTQAVPLRGTFYARVVAHNACDQQAVSNEVPFTITNPCATQAPVLSASVLASRVTFTWTGVTSPTGLAIEFSTVNGGPAQLTESFGATASAYQRTVPFLGTFYARLAVTTSCGVTYSPYIPFTISSLNIGTGPRAPDAEPGFIIAKATLTYGRAIVEDLASRYRSDLLNSCRDTGGTNTFLFRVVEALRERDTRWGLNYKRGWPGDLSEDIVAYNPTSRPDEGETQVYVYDVISGLCGPTPGWSWSDVTNETWAGRGDPLCAPDSYCARWTLQEYLDAGFPPGGMQ